VICVVLQFTKVSYLVYSLITSTTVHFTTIKAVFKDFRIIKLIFNSPTIIIITGLILLPLYKILHATGSCSYSTYQWNTLTKKAVNFKRILKQSSELEEFEIDRKTGCSICEQDQVEISIGMIKPFKVCHVIASKLSLRLEGLLTQGAKINQITAYRVGKTKGNVNAEGNRTRYSNHAESWPQTPHLSLKTYHVCEDDAYLSTADCNLKKVLAPREANFGKTSPYYRRIHIDATNGQRVHGRCESVSNMTTKSQFVLPPVAASYYQMLHPEYESIPQWRSDCVKNLPLLANDSPIELEYPAEGARIKIPVELDGKLGRSVFKAKHRMDKARLFWHLDNVYLGETTFIHEKEIVVNSGWHRIDLVDQLGYRLERWFRVI